jgi:hypothetical protein
MILESNRWIRWLVVEECFPTQKIQQQGMFHLVGRFFHQVFGDSLLAVSVTIPALQETAWIGSSNDLLE